MSPDERFVAGVIDAAGRRASRLVVAEAVALGALAAATAFAVAWVLGVAVARSGAIAAVAGAVVAAAFLLRRRTARNSIVRALEQIEPASRNLLITAHELSIGELVATPAIRARVFADAADVSRRIDLVQVFPATRLTRLAAVACASWLVITASIAWGGGADRSASGGSAGAQITSGQAAGALRVTVTIEPPAYTHLPPQTLDDPAEIQVVEGSTATVAAAGASRRVLVRTTLVKTGYIEVDDGAGGRRIIPVRVSPDALPAVTITAPARDLFYSGGNPRLTFEARATDDFGLRSLALHFTKASGSGEQFEFQNGEIPLTVAREAPREWRGAASRTLADLNLKDGDMLVYRAVAADGRPGDGNASSDAFFIEISRLGVAAGDAFTLPEEETRYALSQQMLIIRTERLIQQRSLMPASEVADAALDLAVEQRMIRAEFVFMLGGEVEDEEVEAEQSTELQEGRMQNRGHRDLRAATVAMSRAEKLLTGVSLPEALTAERAAVTALQRAFTRDRYILRALASRASLDPTRRLTGKLSEAGDWRRLPVDVPPNRRAAVLQDLLRSVAELMPPAPANNAPFRARARVLARQALRLDAESASLREAATELQRAADESDNTTRVRVLAAAAAAISAEARRSIAGAPLPLTSDDGPMAGALADIRDIFDRSYRGTPRR